ncbi:hypothetical protein [Nocardioides aquiterrae]|uniref:Uncharacterized protein n=1 Tax=Nocardioides aquiterrae TaxID=203799 RepID=A0ABN1UAZ9_9ACTN
MDLTTLQPAVIAFFVVAGVAIAMALVALAVLVADARRPAGRVVTLSAAHPAAAGRRAA